MIAYEAREWSDLFVATAGASAALAGLLFVAVSINIERILSFEGLPERGLETVLTLLAVVIVSIVGLIPGQSHEALGAEILVGSVWLGGAMVLLSRRSLPNDTETGVQLAGRIIVRAVGTIPLIVGGLSLLIGSGGGLYWVVAGIVFAIAGAVANAWVLLVEILR